MGELTIKTIAFMLMYLTCHEVVNSWRYLQKTKNARAIWKTLELFEKRSSYLSLYYKFTKKNCDSVCLLSSNLTSMCNATNPEFFRPFFFHAKKPIFWSTDFHAFFHALPFWTIWSLGDWSIMRTNLSTTTNLLPFHFFQQKTNYSIKN